MARYAIIKNGVVDNITLWDGDTSKWSPPQGQSAVVAPSTVQIGSTYAAGVFTPPVAPPVPVPDKVTPLQIRKALRASGKVPALKTFLAAQPDDVLEDWEYAIEITRDNPVIAAAAMALGLNATRVDDLFKLAATL